jgi:hypothetical protein
MGSFAIAWIADEHAIFVEGVLVAPNALAAVAQANLAVIPR